MAQYISNENACITSKHLTKGCKVVRVIVHSSKAMLDKFRVAVTFLLGSSAVFVPIGNGCEIPCVLTDPSICRQEGGVSYAEGLPRTICRKKIQYAIVLMYRAV